MSRTGNAPGLINLEKVKHPDLPVYSARIDIPTSKAATEERFYQAGAYRPRPGAVCGFNGRLPWEKAKLRFVYHSGKKVSE